MLLSKIKIKGCAFCSIDRHTMTSCPQKSSLGNSIKVDGLIEYIENTCAFKIIESDQSCNVSGEDSS